ncbi:Monothiol glutaredoxin-S10 like [Actinidia chinensis var. chinensis]|uniref:Monothiol glutaredoxin-S10 like n=1 Tax=Actinidia chinensis var. chinensis TaxID=1590841 RepID=A0A2R6P713_ACTCC|nr:Monothiol glutaredoxin-S10 like [Actinidia chinensis var. chinensis]
MASASLLLTRGFVSLPLAHPHHSHTLSLSSTQQLRSLHQHRLYKTPHNRQIRSSWADKRETRQGSSHVRLLRVSTRGYREEDDWRKPSCCLLQNVVLVFC